MNNIKLQGINADGIEKEYSLNDFKSSLNLQINVLSLPNSLFLPIAAIILTLSITKSS